MHVVLGALGTLVTILWLLYRLADMGIDLGGLNPFLWQRRRGWKKRHDANPIYKIDSPLEATALLMIAVAKADGDMCSEEKTELLRLFAEEFHMSSREAAGLLISSSYLLRKGDEVRENLKQVLKPSLPNFTPGQARSALDLLTQVSQVAGPASELQEQLITSTNQLLNAKVAENGKWS